jgi:prepilin-type N-terminal cleavage/methylation domain-containing protein
MRLTHPSENGWTRRTRQPGFTLIEVLVVVAILALLIAILLPSLSKAKEKARQSVCLSNLHQQGIGFAAYAAENRHVLPMVGRFRYTLAEGKYYTFSPPSTNLDDWVKVNNGLLYRKYVGANPEIFYCPSNIDADADGNRGMAVFLQRHQHPSRSDPRYVDSHNAANSPIGAYGYALPIASGKSPTDGGAKMYPVEAMVGGAYYAYMTDPAELTDEEATAFLGHFPQPLRGKHGIHALLTDAYFGGYHGYHLNGFNVLYGDYHAKRVPDPAGKIIKGVSGGSVYDTSKPFLDRAKAFMVWDYFSRNP